MRAASMVRLIYLWELSSGLVVVKILKSSYDLVYSNYNRLSILGHHRHNHSVSSAAYTMEGVCKTRVLCCVKMSCRVKWDTCSILATSQYLKHGKQFIIYGDTCQSMITPNHNPNTNPTLPITLYLPY